MALVSEQRRATNLLPYDEWISRKRERDAEDEYDEDDDEEGSLSPEARDDFRILRYCSKLYDEGRAARQPYDTFDIAWDMFVGNLRPRNWPGWRAHIGINKIRAIVTFMQAIMTDTKPRLQVEPTVPGTEDAADLLHQLVDRDWDENDMQDKNSTFVLYGLIFGTSFMKLGYDPFGNGGRGKHTATPIVPYRVYANRNATSIEDAEFIIHEEAKTMGYVRRHFPDRARAVYGVMGAAKRSAREADQSERDLIREGDASNERLRIISSQNVDGNIVGPLYSKPNNEFSEHDHEEINIKEYWFRDDSLEEFQRQKFKGGVAQFEPVTDDEGLYVFETVGQQIVQSELTGAMTLVPKRRVKMKPVMESAWRAKFPNGRLCIIAGDRVVLRDIANPFQTDGFPFAMWKDYDSGAFWGTGEALALKDTQVAYVLIISQLFDIIQKTANPSYKFNKNGGINTRAIRGRPGELIGVSEMGDIAALDKPQIPQQFMELFAALGKSMGDISGANESVMGAMPAANTSFAAVDSLQESGAAPIRLKVRNLEKGLTRQGRLRIALIQQFDRGDRPLKKRDDGQDAAPQAATEPGEHVEPISSTALEWRTYNPADLQGNVQFGVVPISSLSTSPASTWNRLLTLYDKHLIDRRWWHTANRIAGWKTQLPRMEATEAAQAKQAAADHAANGKPGPAGKSLSTGPRRRKGPQGPPSNLPSREANARVR